MPGASRAIFTAICLLALPASAGATTFANRPLGDVVSDAEQIVRGVAGEAYSDWDKAGAQSVYTYTPLTVTETLKGDLAKDARITLRQPGGSKDGVELSVSGTAHFSPGEEVVVLLGKHNAEDDSYDVPGFATGKYRVVHGQGDEIFLENSLGGGSVYDPGKDPGTLSYNSRIPLDVFRKLAKGQSAPEADRPQYRGSQQAPAHDEHDHAAPPTATSAPAAPQADRSIDQARPDAGGRSSGWIPISFALIALFGALGLWRLLRKGGHE